MYLCQTFVSPRLQAIHGYRETERVTWGSACEEILNRVRSVAFREGSQLLGPVHVLDLDKAGYIKPHIDSVKVGVVCNRLFLPEQCPQQRIP